MNVRVTLPAKRISSGRNLVIDAFEMVLFQRRAQGTTGLIFHSDRHSQQDHTDFHIPSATTTTTRMNNFSKPVG